LIIEGEHAMGAAMKSGMRGGFAENAGFVMAALFPWRCIAGNVIASAKLMKVTNSAKKKVILSARTATIFV